MDRLPRLRVACAFYIGKKRRTKTLAMYVGKRTGNGFRQRTTQLGAILNLIGAVPIARIGPGSRAVSVVIIDATENAKT